MHLSCEKDKHTRAGLSFMGNYPKPLSNPSMSQVALYIREFFSMEMSMVVSLEPPNGNVMVFSEAPFQVVMVSSAGMFSDNTGIEMDIKKAHRMVIMILLMLSRPLLKKIYSTNSVYND